MVFLGWLKSTLKKVLVLVAKRTRRLSSKKILITTEQESSRLSVDGLEEYYGLEIFHTFALENILAQSIMSSAGSKQPSLSSPTPSSQSSKTEKEKGKLHIVIAPNGSVVGNNSRKWSNRCGDFVRACVPVHYPDWRQVPKNFKDDVWRNLMDEFALDIPEEVARPMLEKGWSQKFRTYKTTLRKSLESENEEAPRGMDPNHWKEFSENENKPKKKEQKIKNAENRAQLQYSHCLGRYSYAQKTYELYRSGPDWEEQSLDPSLLFLLFKKVTPTPTWPMQWPIIGSLHALFTCKPVFRWIHRLMREMNT
ncbi:hypothetical protein LguiB_027141 [Lonicera macranthoides]